MWTITKNNEKDNVRPECTLEGNKEAYIHQLYAEGYSAGSEQINQRSRSIRRLMIIQTITFDPFEYS